MGGNDTANAEMNRLREDAQRIKNWKRWGPYLSERQWGTVREDYSADGSCWEYFPHDQARSRTYRWGEDGILGLDRPRVPAVFRPGAVERPGPDPEGAHVRPDQSRRQPRRRREGALLLPRCDTHAFLHARLVPLPPEGISLYPAPRGEPAPGPRSAGVRNPRHRRVPATAGISMSTPNTPRPPTTTFSSGSPCAIGRTRKPSLHLLPTLWFRNTWVWGCRHEEDCPIKPIIEKTGVSTLLAEHETLGRFRLRDRPRPGGTPAAGAVHGE